MALNVRFLKGTAAQYSALATKDVNTFYFTQDDSKLYLGTIELSTPAGVSAAIALVNDSQKGNNALKTAIDALTTGEDSVDAKIEDKIEEILGDDADLTQLTTTAKTIIAAINELDTAIGSLETASEIALETKGTANTGAAKTYVVKQGGTSIGEIDIPKDMVVSAGEVITLTAQEAQAIDVSYTAGKYIKLTIANSTSDELYIPVSALVDVYTAAANATQVQVVIDNSTNVVSASIVAGSVTATELASNAVTTIKIADNNVTTDKIANKAITEAKLSDDINASLDKADSAVQSILTGATNGTINVDGSEVSVFGLGTAAYTASTAYDAAGSASTAQSNAEAYTDDALTWQSIVNE